MKRLILQPSIGLPPPIGHVHLYQGVNAIGSAAHGTDWVSVCCQFDLKHQLDANSDVVDAVVKNIATACEAGKIDVGYPNVHGTVDSLDRSEWQKSRWPSYFRAGTIDLHDLPLLDDRLRPVPDGRTVPVCTRKIFFRKDSLDDFVKSIAPTTTEPKPETAPGHYGSDGPLLEEMRRLIASGMTLTKASMTLADRAEGGGIQESKARRLREKFRALQEV